ncbi:MAG: hypothetical protein MZV70_54650 [Desulfobacterales bacterium]|nr:hypothetical protein [Desulfobacterales bacterium]
MVESLVNEKLSAYFEENPAVAQQDRGKGARGRAGARCGAAGPGPDAPQGSLLDADPARQAG